MVASSSWNLPAAEAGAVAAKGGKRGERRREPRAACLAHDGDPRIVGFCIRRSAGSLPLPPPQLHCDTCPPPARIFQRMTSDGQQRAMWGDSAGPAGLGSRLRGVRAAAQVASANFTRAVRNRRHRGALPRRNMILTSRTFEKACGSAPVPAESGGVLRPGCYGLRATWPSTTSAHRTSTPCSRRPPRWRKRLPEDEQQLTSNFARLFVLRSPPGRSATGNFLRSSTARVRRTAADR